MSDYEESIAKKIIQILKETNATVKDISKTLYRNENIIRGTINRMKKHNLIKETGYFKNRYKVYSLGDFDTIKKDKLYAKYREILIKMILPFAKTGIQIKLRPEESEMIKELFQENYLPSGEKKDE